MFKILKKWIIGFLVFLNASVFALNVNFSDPTSTPFGTPDLSESSENAVDSQITTDSSGRYVYAIWKRTDFGTGKNVIQTTISSDFGVTWSLAANRSNPIQGTADPQITTDSSGKYIYAIWQRLATKNVVQTATSSDFGVTWSVATDRSDSNQHAADPQITTDTSGRYVHAIWKRQDNGTGNFVIRTTVSSDFGVTWSVATDRSGSGQIAYEPQITTDSSGRYVHAIWRKIDDGAGKKDVIQTASSSDFGVTWSGATDQSESSQNAYDPQIIIDRSGRHAYAIWRRKDKGTGGYAVQTRSSSDFGVTWSGVTDLSDSSQFARNPQITTDSSGRYVHAIWRRDDGTLTYVIQTTTSSDFGVTWSGVTDLSDSSQTAFEPQITTDRSGRYIYAIWRRLADGVGGKEVIQTNISSDFGITWENPNTTPTGSPPDLSDSSRDAFQPQIIIDSSGRHAYAIWRRIDNVTGEGTIQMANAYRTFFPVKNLSIIRN